MLNFNNNNIITGEIKQFLKEFNLPKCRVWRPELPVFSGCLYVYGSGIYRVSNIVTDGTVLDDIDTTYMVQEEVDGVIKTVEKRAFEFVCSYKYGEDLLNITKNLIINGLYYDSYTHKYLGEYLRFYKDYVGIDLMSMYNCYCDEMVKSMALKFKVSTKDSTTQEITTKDIEIINSSESVIYAVPVRFFEDYTIGIDCSGTVEIVAGFYDNGKIVSLPGKEEENVYTKTYMRESNTRMSRPVLYSKLKDFSFSGSLTKTLYQHEHVLKLFIKVPTTLRSSITVLEGDFSEFGELNFPDVEHKVDGRMCLNDRGLSFRVPTLELNNYETTDGAKFEKTYYSIPQLLFYNTYVSHPFADRLIEYIFGNVIKDDDEIRDDVVRIQKRLLQRYLEGKLGMRYPSGHSGVWDTKLRNICYEIVRNGSSMINSRSGSRYDQIGYVDKDAEKIIGDYKEA